MKLSNMKNTQSDSNPGRIVKSGMRMAMKKMAMKMVYSLLSLYYVLSGSETSVCDKIKIYGAFVYILLPHDIIPDSIYLAGCTDDFAALIILWQTIRTNLSLEISSMITGKIQRWFEVDAGNGQKELCQHASNNDR